MHVVNRHHLNVGTVRRAMSGWRRIGIESSPARKLAGFTLMESVISVALMGIFVAAAMSALVADQVCSRKAKEQAIGMDFLTKYAENIKALPFNSVAAGQPINSIYDGVSGAPLIIIPTNGTVLPLTTTAFQIFYPDLIWLSNRSPTLTVTLTTNSVSGALHDIEINARVDWNAPL